MQSCCAKLAWIVYILLLCVNQDTAADIAGPKQKFPRRLAEGGCGRPLRAPDFNSGFGENFRKVLYKLPINVKSTCAKAIRLLFDIRFNLGKKPIWLLRSIPETVGGII